MIHSQAVLLFATDGIVVLAEAILETAGEHAKPAGLLHRADPPLDNEVVGVHHYFPTTGHAFAGSV
jgi:hypothetical protein